MGNVEMGSLPMREMLGSRREAMNQIEKRVIELTYRNGLTHLSSCLNCVNLIDEIYYKKGDLDPFILGNGHASLALYVVLEKHGWCDAQEMIEKHGVHASRDMEHGIWCSNGSLGQAETVAVGFALADPNRKVWLVTSDGSCREGATMEVLREKPKNLEIYVVFNGLGAYSEVYRHDLPFGDFILHEVDENNYPKWLRGLSGHYLKLDERMYNELMNYDS